MIIAVASGKGGTGKTTVATNLATALAMPGHSVTYVDCDVEEPNGHIFLRPTLDTSREISVLVPEVDESRCTFCGACRAACRFSALLVFPRRVMVFPKLCHSCGGCQLACPEQAICEVPRRIGVLEAGAAGAVGFLHGRLDVGEAMAPPLIRAVLGAAPTTGTVVIDAPPGTSCPVIESIKPADVVLLVTEPTPFGVSDLELAVETVRGLGRPFGVAVNRAGSGDREVYHYCEREGIPIVLEIPDDLEIARAYSRGDLAITVRPELAPGLRVLHRRLEELARLEHRTGYVRSRKRGSTSHPCVARRSLGTTQLPPRALACSHLHVFARSRNPFGARGPVPRREPAAAAELSVATETLPPSAKLPDGRQPRRQELVVISGKGGTGKTSIAAALFALAETATIADCDVDAADLHLVLDPTVRGRWPFSGGQHATIDPDLCSGCGVCAESCRFHAIDVDDATGVYRVDPIACEGCGVCADLCPMGAAALVPSTNGEWMVSDTRFGPMVHARLGIAEENSGKLVALVRREGNACAMLHRSELLIADGSPGIGCSVIASVTGAAQVLVVTEPTLSGLHDLERVAELTRQLEVPTAVCINKLDINLEIAAEITRTADRLGLPVVGRIRYDPSVTAAQVQRKTVVEGERGPAARDLEKMWRELETLRQDRCAGDLEPPESGPPWHAAATAKGNP